MPRPRRLLLEPLEERTLLTLAPVLVDLQPGSDSGLYGDDNLTNVSTPIIDITAAEPDDVINIYRESALLGQATQVSGTSYQYEFGPDQLIEGANSISARSFDGVEESGDSPPLLITLDVTGPWITASTPDVPFDLRTDPLDSVSVTFSEDIEFDPAGGESFTAEDVSITGPEGNITPSGITSLGGNDYEVAFAGQTERGKHTVSVGPDVIDLAGNVMDQDEDGLQGEAEEDVFIFSFHAFDADTVFAAAATISEGDTTYDGQDIAIDGATVTIDGPHGFNSVHLLGSAVLTHSANSSTQTHKLDLTVMEQLIVDTTSRIDVSGKGYLPGYTTGNTTEGGATHKSGGSYGGIGRGYYAGVGTTNAVYGHYANPDDWGSGGADRRGGGLVRIVAGALSLEGELLANGSGGGDSGGSGGGIYVEVATFQGAGRIEATGGIDGGGVGGSGGGGRVAVYAEDLSTFLGTIEAGGGERYGGAGTVYLKDTDEPHGTLIVDGGTAAEPRATPLGLPEDDTFTIPDAVIIRSGSVVWPEHDDLLVTFQNHVTISDSGRLLIFEAVEFTDSAPLLVTSGGHLQIGYLDSRGTLHSQSSVRVDGGKLTGGRIEASEVTVVNEGLLTSWDGTDSQTHKLELVVAGTVLVDTTSRIDVSGKGYLPGYTTGNTTEGGATHKSGGSYGGMGRPYGGGTTNAMYGDYADPDDWGSGGADRRGGGLVRIVAETLSLDGQLLANGSSSSGGSGNAGGSGGGIYVEVATFEGGGQINAAGGGGSGGGSGGGGRVAVYAEESFGFDTGSIKAEGGTGGAGNGSDGSVHLLEGRPHTHVKSYLPTGERDNVVSDLGYHTLRFSRPIDTDPINAANILIEGPLGPIVAAGISLVDDKTYRIDFPTQTENGYYHFTVLPTLLDAEGFELDQDADGVPGEAEDFYEFTLILDTVPLRVTNHAPAGDITGTVDHVDVWLSETVDSTTFTVGDVAITDPSGQPVAVSTIEEVGLNRFRIGFAALTVTGTYHVEIGPDLTDLAGNALNQDGDDVFGEASEDVYDATFNLVPVDLQVSNIVVDPTDLWAGEAVTVSWEGANASGAELLGNWTDAIYLSADDQWDINDTLLATVEHSGGLPENEPYEGSGSGYLPGALPGDYYIIVRADVFNQEQEAGGEGNNFAVAGPFTLDVRPLAADGTSSGGSLTAEDPADYYSIDVAPEDNLRIVLDGYGATGSNELFVSLEVVPTRLNYDYHATEDGQHQVLVIPGDPSGGTYYVLVYGDQIGADTAYDVTAATGPIILAAATPDGLGNAEPGTVTLTGAGFDPSTTVEFIASDESVFAPTEVQYASASTLTVSLDLPTWPADVYDVRVTKEIAGGGLASDELPNVFEVVQGGAAHLETNLILPRDVGFAIPIRQTIWVEYQNTGTLAMPAPLLRLHGSHGARLTLDREITPQRGFGEIPGASDTVQMLGLGTTSAPWLLQPGESVRIPVYYIGLSQASSYPRVEFHLDYITDQDSRTIDWAEQEALVRPVDMIDAVWELFLGALEERVGQTWGDYARALSESARTFEESQGRLPDVLEAWNWLLSQPARVSTSRMSVSNPSTGVLQQSSLPLVSISKFTYVTEGDLGSIHSAVVHVSLSEVSQIDVTVEWETWQGGLPGAPNADPGVDYVYSSGTVTIPAGWFHEYIHVPIIGDEIVEPAEMFVVYLVAATGASLRPFPGRDGYVMIEDDDPAPTPPPPPSPPPGPGNGGSSQLVGSFDPNDKIAPAGYGEAGYIQAGAIVPYQVRFENKEDATAPAREIVVTDMLDENLDLTTLELTEIAFANQTISIPAGLNHYQTTLPFDAEGTEILVNVNAALDFETRKLVITLRAVDPATGWFPEDPLVGLLYPNDETGRGDGHVSYLVSPAEGVPSGTVIENRATIVFDWNDPIDTPLVVNTIDALPPTSQIDVLPDEAPGIRAVISWSGQDEPGGSGIAGYDIFVSENDGPFTLWLDDTAETSAELIGAGGHTYAFYSIATDNVGHVELPPETADTQTTLPIMVLGRKIFYNNSAFDGNDPAPNEQDDLAIATDKEALRPGGTGEFANYTSYSRGINGIMVDVAGLADAENLSASDDFEFKLGNDNAPDSWPTAATPTIDVRPGDGEYGSDRVTLIWEDNVIPTRNWLQVRVKATPNTGLAQDEVFYFGNAVGDADGDRVAACADMYAIYQQSGQPATVDDPLDVNRDGTISEADIDAVFAEIGRLPVLEMIRVPHPADEFLMDAANQYAVSDNEADLGSPIVPLYTDHNAGGTYGQIQAGSYSPPPDLPGSVTWDENCADAGRGVSSLEITWDRNGQNGWFEFNIGTGAANRPRDIAEFGDAEAVRFMAKGDTPQTGVDDQQVRLKILRTDPTDGWAELTSEVITLDTAWADFALDLSVFDLTPPELHSVQLVLGDELNPGGGTIWLDEVRITADGYDPLRVLQSYQPRCPTEEPPFTPDMPQWRDENVYPKLSSLYDNALAIKTLLATGDPQAQNTAVEVADAIITTASPDGSYYQFRNGGHVLDGDGTPRSPLDQSRSLGDNAWLGLALLDVYRTTGDGAYLGQARAISDWAETNLRYDGTWGGYQGGRGSDGVPLLWRSTEHNIDLFALNRQLATELGNLGDPDAATYAARATHAGDFVMAMFDPLEGKFWTGTGDGTGIGLDEINTTSVPLDTQMWSVLTLGLSSEYAAAIDWSRPIQWAEANLRVTAGPFSGFTFDTGATPDRVWFEGTAHAAAVYYALGEVTKYEHTVQTLERARRTHPNGDGHGLVAASDDGLQTGFGGWYDARLHVGATAWSLIAQMGINPFEIAGHE